MPLTFIRNDIVNMDTDAIVIPANENLIAGTGTSEAVFLAAGFDKLTESCRKIGQCELGKAVITDGFALPARHIIHAVCPIWIDGEHSEDLVLYETYRNALELAEENGMKSVAFALLSTGNYRYPKDKALNVAVHAISDYLMEREMDIQIVLFDRESLEEGSRLFRDVKAYIDDNYVSEHEARNRNSWIKDPEAYIREQPHYKQAKYAFRDGKYRANFTSLRYQKTFLNNILKSTGTDPQSKGIDDIESRASESFSQRLFKLIDERGMTDPEVYKKANVSKAVFSNIRKDEQYEPTKPIILALAIALELDMFDTKELLMKAGYAFSDNNQFDLVVAYFIENRIYDIYTINLELYKRGLRQLGSKS